MKKSALKNLISSFAGHHTDLEHSQMSEAIEDIDDKLEEILMLIDNEDKDENFEDQSKLASLIKTVFHNHIFLYERYDQLIEKLNKSSIQKQEMTRRYADGISSSETSDSELSEFCGHNESKENGIIYAQRNEEDLANKLARKAAACLSLQNEMASMRGKINVLEAENASLCLILEKINQQQSSESAVSIREENEALISGNSILLQTLYDSESSVKGLKVENQTLKDEVEKLKNNCEMKDEIALSLNKAREELKEVAEENKRLLVENSSLRKSMAELEHQKSNLQRGLEDKGKEVAEITKELEDIDIELMIENASDPQVELDVSLNQENGWKSKRELRFERLSDMYKLLQAGDEAIGQLEMNIEGKKVEIARLQDKQRQILKKLKLTEAQKAQVDDDMEKLHEAIGTLEVHLCLTNQKFKTTKSEYKEKEELHKRKMKEMQEKCRELEGQNKDMKDEINYVDYQLNQVKEAMEMGLTKLTGDFQSLKLAFEESCKRLQTRLSDCSKDLRVLKETMESSKRNLEQNAKVADFKEKIAELEKIVTHKEEECKLKDEEKREAIRQLCLPIYYQRENYKYLLQERSTKHRGIKKSFSSKY